MEPRKHAAPVDVPRTTVTAPSARSASPARVLATDTVAPRFDGEPVSYTHLDVYKRQVVFQRRGGVEGLQAVEAEREAQDEQHGEQDAQPTLAERLLDVVGRAAAELALLACLLYTSRCV